MSLPLNISNKHSSGVYFVMQGPLIDLDASGIKMPPVQGNKPGAEALICIKAPAYREEKRETIKLSISKTLRSKTKFHTKGHVFVSYC
jgi:hypothetical protein